MAQNEALSKFLAGQHLTHRQAAVVLTVGLMEIGSRSDACLDAVEHYQSLMLVAIMLARRGISLDQVAAIEPGTQAAPSPNPSPSQIMQAINAAGVTSEDVAESIRQFTHVMLKEKPAARPALLKVLRDLLREFEAN